MADTPTPSTWVTLQNLRLNRGWTLTRLASEAGLSLPGVSQIESGKRTPRPGTRKKLADALGVKPSDLTRP